MTRRPEQATSLPEPRADVESVEALKIIASLPSVRKVDVEKLLATQLENRYKMELRAWRYRIGCLVSGLGVFAFLAWFAVELSEAEQYLEAVGVVGFGGLPMVALFVTGEVVSRKMMK